MSENAPKTRRRRRSPQEWTRIVRGWPGSGLSAEAYAQKEGVGVDSLWRWAGRVRQQEAAATRPAAPSPREEVAPRFVAVQVSEGKNPPRSESTGRGGIEVSWPGGAVVRVHGDVPASTVAAVLRVVAEVMPC